MHILRRIPLWAAIALLVYMPFHIFLSQFLSLATGGLEAWKVGKDVFLALATMFTICLVWQQRQQSRLFNLFVGIAAIYFVLHLSAWALNPDTYQRSALLGMIYNMRLPALLLLGYGAILLWPKKFAFSSVLQIVLGVSTVVACLGILQYFLPGDLLAHFGYGLERGARVAFFIEDNPDLPRVMSTLREPNALGAYLILPIVALAMLIIRAAGRVRYLYASMVVVHTVALFLTFSRSAWLGLFLGLVLAAWLQYRREITSVFYKYWPLLVAVTVTVGLVAFSVRSTDVFQKYIIHSDPTEQAVDLDSNDLHILLAKEGLEGIANRPLGHGPGTAGLVSIQNPAGGQLTENYYIQIGYEIGVLGLAVFLALHVLVYAQLWRHRSRGYVTTVLCASFWSYVLINMLLHSWSNEAVAAQWWILAGLTIAKLGADTPADADVR